MAGDFPSVLSGLRREKHVNQRTAAAALNISQALLSHYENGLREPGFDFIDSACRYYGVSADYLLGRSLLKVPFVAVSEYDDAYLNNFSEMLNTAFSELFKGLSACNSQDTKETIMSMLIVFLYGIMRKYDKTGKFEISSLLSPALCDALIKAYYARLLSMSMTDESKLSFTVPQNLIKAAETELALIINDWK